MGTEEEILATNIKSKNQVIITDQQISSPKIKGNLSRSLELNRLLKIAGVHCTPRIICLGDQSSGKSITLGRLLGFPIGRG